MEGGVPRVSARVASRSSSPANFSPRGSPLTLPWAAQHENELRQQAEMKYSQYKARADRAEEEVRTLRAALAEASGAVQCMDRGGSQFYREVGVLRAKMARCNPWLRQEAFSAIIK